MLRSPEVIPITAIGVVLFGLIFSNRRWKRFIAMNFDLLLQLQSRGIVSIPKLYRVRLALLAQDKHFMKLVLYVLRTDKLAKTSFSYSSLLLIRTMPVDESGVQFSSTISCPLVHGSSREMYGLIFLWMGMFLSVNWCHVSWSHWWEITSIYLTEEHATCPPLICCVISGVRIHCL